jgi:hypothetical protein
LTVFGIKVIQSKYIPKGTVLFLGGDVVVMRDVEILLPWWERLLLWVWRRWR